MGYNRLSAESAVNISEHIKRATIFVDSLIKELNQTLNENILEMLEFNCINKIADAINRELLKNQQINMNLIDQWDLDSAYAQEYSQNKSEKFVESFREARETISLLKSTSPLEYLESPSRMKLYSRINVAVLIAIMKRCVDLNEEQKRLLEELNKL